MDDVKQNFSGFLKKDGFLLSNHLFDYLRNEYTVYRGDSYLNANLRESNLMPELNEFAINN